MSESSLKDSRLLQCGAAWSVHLLTASGGVLGLYALYAIHTGQFLLSFWLMGAAIIIDAVDGTFARMVRVKEYAGKIDGSLLDNIIDFVNYVITPAFFLLVSDLLPYGWRAVCGAVIVLTSSYQFSQRDAKTRDHFFKGFPSYWNIVVFYLFFWQMNQFVNLTILFLLSFMVFVPIKYIYPTRMEYLTSSKLLRQLMLLATVVWGAATLSLLWIYPDTDYLLLGISVGYLILYFFISLYRTLFPLEVSA